MNYEPIEKIFKIADTVKLDKKKKDIIHQEILLFMKRNPLKEKNLRKKWFGFYIPNINNFRLKSPAVVLVGIMFFLLMGGVAKVKADSALPGDVFYSMKLGFNEKIKEAFAFSDEAKLNLYIELSEVRLQEFGKLSVQGKINSSNEAQINGNFKNHSDKISEYINKLNLKKNTEKAEKVITNFEASLKAQSIIINGLQKNTDDTNSVIISSVKDVTSKISNFNADLNNSKDNNIKPLDKDKNIQEKISTIQNSVTKVRKLMEKNKAKIGSKAVSQSEDNLNLVQQKIDEVKNKLLENKNDYKGLSSSLHEASIIVQQSKYLIEAKENLGVDIPININSKNNLDNKKEKESNNSKTNKDSININKKVKTGL